MADYNIKREFNIDRNIKDVGKAWKIAKEQAESFAATLDLQCDSEIIKTYTGYVVYWDYQQRLSPEVKEEGFWKKIW
jgi:hypothetical protein